MSETFLESSLVLLRGKGNKEGMEDTRRCTAALRLAEFSPLSALTGRQSPKILEKKVRKGLYS